MKKVIYARADGGVSVFNPCEGARLALGLHDAEGQLIAASKVPVPVDSFLRRWPVDGVKAVWAETEEDFIARVSAKSIPADAINVQVVDESVIPQDRTFRNAWKVGNGCVEHDLPKCREIHKQRLRELRAPKLAALDVEYMRALEAGDSAKAAEIASKKQALRDVTKDPAIAKAKTPDELKSVLPDVLRQTEAVLA